MDNVNGIRAILFDAGNTLVTVDPRELSEIFGPLGAETDRARIREAELEARRVLHDAIRHGHVGTEPEVWRGYFGALFRACGVPTDQLEEAGRELRARHRARHLWTRVEDGADGVLRHLGEAGYRLGVISNADGRIQELLGRVGLLEHFEFVLDSEVVGVEKPEPAIFLEGCRRLGLAPESCLYVGDLYPVDYLGARQAGLQAVLLDPLALYGGRAATIGALADLPAFLSGPGHRGDGAEFPTLPSPA